MSITCTGYKSAGHWQCTSINTTKTNTNISSSWCLSLAGSNYKQERLIHIETVRWQKTTTNAKKFSNRLFNSLYNLLQWVEQSLNVISDLNVGKYISRNNMGFLLYLCASQICRYRGSCIVVLYTVVQEQNKSEWGAINNQEDLGHYLTKSYWHQHLLLINRTCTFKWRR